jgi:hypothetical protein
MVYSPNETKIQKKRKKPKQSTLIGQMDKEHHYETAISHKKKESS